MWLPAPQYGDTEHGGMYAPAAPEQTNRDSPSFRAAERGQGPEKRDGLPLFGERRLYRRRPGPVLSEALRVDPVLF